MRIAIFLYLILASYLGKTQNDSIILNHQERIYNDSFKIVIEKEPQFPGGEKAMFDFIDKNIIYPSIAIDNDIEGVVKLRFKVDTTGIIRDIVVVLNKERIGYGMEEAAVEVLKKMPKWIPGQQNGILITLPVNISIQFSLLQIKSAISNSSPNNSYELDTLRVSMDKMPNNVYLISTVKPQFPGGKEAMIEFISKTLIYPKQAINNKIQGKVNLKFIIDSLGKICCIDIIGEPLGYGLEQEAKRILRAMPLWIPAYIDGKPVTVYYRMPINFRYYEE